MSTFSLIMLINVRQGLEPFNLQSGYRFLLSMVLTTLYKSVCKGLFFCKTQTSTELRMNFDVLSKTTNET